MPHTFGLRRLVKTGVSVSIVLSCDRLRVGLISRNKRLRRSWETCGSHFSGDRGRQHLRSDWDSLNMKQKTKVSIDGDIMSDSMAGTSKMTPVSRKGNSHQRVKGQRSNEVRLVQDNIYNRTQHQWMVPAHKAINVQRQQNNLSSPGPAVRSGKGSQGKKKKSPLYCHQREPCGLHLGEWRANGVFQATCCRTDKGNCAGSVMNQINPNINTTIHPVGLSMRDEAANDELDDSMVESSVLACPVLAGEETEDLHLSVTNGDQRCHPSLVSENLGLESHPWFGMECFRDISSSENPTMEATRRSLGPNVPPSFSHSRITSSSFHDPTLLSFCPNLEHPSSFLHSDIDKPLSKEDREMRPYYDLFLDFPEKESKDFYSKFHQPSLEFPSEFIRTSTTLPRDVESGQHGGCWSTGLGPWLVSEDGGDVFHEGLVISEEEYGATSLKKHKDDLQTFQSHIFKETITEFPEKSPPSRYLRHTDRLLLSRCLRAWNKLIKEKYETAQRLCERHLLQKGLRALAWAIILQDREAGDLRVRCSRAADKYRALEMEADLQEEVEKNLLRRCFVRWKRHSENVQSARMLHSMVLQRRTFSAWLVHTRQVNEQAQLVKRQVLLGRGCWALWLWRRRLFQRREADLRHQRRKHALLHAILSGWHRYCQRKNQLSDRLILWEELRVEQVKRAVVRRWRDQLTKGLQAMDYWQRLMMGRYFRIWRVESTNRVLGGKAHAFRMAWSAVKMRASFTQWKNLSDTHRECCAFLRRRESRICRGVMGRWRQYTMEEKAGKMADRRRRRWALTRWKVELQLKVALIKYGEVKNLHRMANYWQIWVWQLQLTVECRWYHGRVLRKRAFTIWASAARRHPTWRVKAVRFRSEICHRILQSCFDRWKAGLTLRRSNNDWQPSHLPRISLHCWEAATRGHQELRLRTDNSETGL
ncbi:uncharacterized protein C1orf167 homolog [Pyxicephalus adspersus]|uniref:uncharacterized protein C1orf167 homolog n=1 Tax=Pyxicephalus adspersus TaxID=30357 RepID=UPI003B5B55FD